MTAIIVAVCAFWSLVGGWAFLRSVKREDERRRQSTVTGTLIPPGYAAIVSGHQSEPGEWVPPGFAVTMGPGHAADAQGTTVVGADARAYNAPGATVMGAGARSGTRPY